jgi:G3E family GTPase
VNAGRLAAPGPASTSVEIDAPIPVSVLTGFLGSGKTTLLARLLRHPAMARTAVIINEFGEVGIDHDLVETSEESVVQLTTGCLCCKVASDLALTLADLARRRIAGSVPAFERVVIETSGLADPAPILHTLMQGGMGRDGVEYVLGGVVATVDGVLGKATLDRHEVSMRQAAMADRIVLTKLDMAHARPAALRERLARVNPEAAVIEGSQAADPEILFGHEAAHRRSPDSRTGDAHEPLHHEHDNAIVSCSLIRRQPLKAVTLALFLEALADHCGAGLLRMKGIVHVAERPGQPAVVHGVQHIFNAPAWLDDWPGPDRATRMVFIGRSIPQDWLHALLDLLELEVADETARASHAPAGLEGAG